MGASDFMPMPTQEWLDGHIAFQAFLFCMKSHHFSVLAHQRSVLAIYLFFLYNICKLPQLFVTLSSETQSSLC